MTRESYTSRLARVGVRCAVCISAVVGVGLLCAWVFVNDAKQRSENWSGLDDL